MRQPAEHIAQLEYRPVVSSPISPSWCVSVNDLAMSKSASTWAYGDAGTRYLQIDSECA